MEECAIYMKKLISVLLCVLMLLAMAVPAFAAQDVYPIVYIEGQGCSLFRPDGSKIYGLEVEVLDVVKDNLKDLLKEYGLGMISGDYSTYNDKLYNTIAPLYKDVKLDNNGQVTDGSAPNPARNWRKNINNIANTINTTTGTAPVYRWVFDWRLSPLTLADELAGVIDAVLAKTGKTKVNIISRCLGCNIAYAYLYNYGTDKVNSCVFYAPMIDGIGVMNALFTGNITIEAGALDRFITYFQDENNFIIRDEDTTDLIMTTLSLFDQIGVLGVGADFAEKIVGNVKDDVIPRIVKDSFATFPSYWSMISPEYVEDAKAFVFNGCEDDYAGLIDQIDAYAAIVQDTHGFLKSIEDKVQIGVVTKYGFPCFPLSEDAGLESDVYVTAGLASFGATVASSGAKLDSKYIKAQTAAGKGNYISADGKIDASTALFPDTTWFIKDLEHKAFPDCVNDLMLAFVNTPCMTVKTDAKFTQFLQFTPTNDESSDSARGTLTPILTADDTEDSTKQYPVSPLDAFFKFLAKIIRFFTKLFKK